jgi:hypothetical protein
LLFKKGSNESVAVSTEDFANIAPLVSKVDSPWTDFEIRTEPATEGSFRNFREHPQLSLDEQPLIQDIRHALSHSFREWRGPSWDFFVHAVNNHRAISVITARGHKANTIKRAINELVLNRDLGSNPNYLSVYPVTEPSTRVLLGDDFQNWSTTALKKAAIFRAVQDAFECFGQNPYHRCGMSDDDPANLLVIREAFQELKKQYPQNAFYVISTSGRQLVKEEIREQSSVKTEQENEVYQVRLFD